MIRHSGPKILISAAAFIAAGFYADCPAADYPPHAPAHILIINSYHAGNEWSDNIIQGITTEFSRRKVAAEFQFEYLDAKRFDTALIYPALEQLFYAKYSSTPLNAVILCDDDAFTFALAREARLFGRAPLIFCGVNDFADSMIRGNDCITGVVECTDLAGTIDLALRLFPKSAVIASICDNTATGIAMEKQLRALLPSYQSRIQFKLFHNYTEQNLIDSLQALPANALVLALPFRRDGSGKSFTQEQAADLMTASNRPVFTCWDTRIKNGIFGGLVTSGIAQGQLAAKLALRVVRGASPSGMPVIRTNSNVPMFTSEALERFKIPESKLPPGSIVLHQTKTFYDKYGKYLWAIGFIIVAQAVLIVVLILTMLQRKKDRQALRRSEQTFRNLFEKNALVMFLVDPVSSRILDVNAAAERFYGYVHDQFLSKTIANLEKEQSQSADDPPAEKDRFAEYRIADHCLSNGETRTVEIRASRIRMPNNQDVLYTVVTDISETRRMEEQLHQNEKMQAIGRLAGGIAHDFNNQLTGIMGCAEMLRMELINNKELLEYANTIIGVAKRSAVIIAQLLAFARKGKFQTIPVNMHEVIGEVVHLLKHSIDKRILIKQRLDANPGTVLGDPAQLQNAVLNCALNARDAMPNGGDIVFHTDIAQLDATFCKSSSLAIAPGRYLLIGIADTGAGIDPESRKHLFEPFFTTKKRGHGTGLGLAAVYGTMKTHNGAIEVETAVGKGTTFKLYFPVAEEKNPTNDSQVLPVAAGEHAASILIVDDEEIVRSSMAKILKRLGYTVVSCATGEEAVRRYQAKGPRFDLVILDMIMPGRSGKETFEALIAIDPRAKVLLASGYSLDSETQKVLDMGAAGFLQKPFDMTEFSNKVAQTLKG